MYFVKATTLKVQHELPWVHVQCRTSTNACRKRYLKRRGTRVWPHLQRTAAESAQGMQHKEHTMDGPSMRYGTIRRIYCCTPTYHLAYIQLQPQHTHRDRLGTISTNSGLRTRCLGPMQVVCTPVLRKSILLQALCAFVFQFLLSTVRFHE